MKLDVKSYVAQEKEKLKQEINNLDFVPSLLILQRGNDSASNAYINGKMRDGEDLKLKVDLFKTNNPKSILEYLQKNARNYKGIILQEPSGLTTAERDRVLELICDSQDVDGFKTTSLHKPCTPAGIMGIIEHFYSESLKGTTVVVVGKGALVGKPLVPMLMEKGATVISCNSATNPLAAYTKMGDIVVVAAGVPGLITRDMLKDNALVIDAGISVDAMGRLHGDCDSSLYDDENIRVTPVPGGVGLTTRLQLMKNVVRG